MGLLEQIQKQNQELLSIVKSLSANLSEMRAENKQKDNELVLKFSGDDSVPFNIAAKALNIKQRQLNDLIKKGAIRPFGNRNRNFRAGDLIAFLSTSENSENKLLPKKRKKIKETDTHDFASDSMVELLKINKIKLNNQKEGIPN